MKRLFILMAGIFIIFCFQFPALGASAIKIAVMDMEKLQNQSKAFQKERAKLKRKFDGMQKKLKDEEQAIRKLEEDYNKQSMMLSLDAQQDKKRELERRKRHYKYLYEDFTKEMKDEESDATKAVGKKLEKILENLAKKEGFTLIFEKRTIGLIYYNDALDITDQVTEAYDKTQQ